jgi:hypothetical protein
MALLAANRAFQTRGCSGPCWLTAFHMALTTAIWSRSGAGSSGMPLSAAYQRLVTVSADMAPRSASMSASGLSSAYRRAAGSDSSESSVPEATSVAIVVTLTAVGDTIRLRREEALMQATSSVSSLSERCACRAFSRTSGDARVAAADHSPTTGAMMPACGAVWPGTSAVPIAAATIVTLSATEWEFVPCSIDAASARRACTALAAAASRTSSSWLEKVRISAVPRSNFASTDTRGLARSTATASICPPRAIPAGAPTER